MKRRTTMPALGTVAALCACLLAAPAALAQALPPPHGPEAGPPFLRGLALSEEQQDRVFAILHEQAPKRRALGRAERKAGDALRELARAPQLDEARAAASAQALGQAIADQELLRLQIGARLKALLTPDQRQQLEQRRGEADEAGDGAPDEARGERRGERHGERHGGRKGGLVGERGVGQ